MRYVLVSIKLPIPSDDIDAQALADSIATPLKMQAGAMGGQVEARVITDTPSASTEVPELETGNRAQ